MTDCSHDSYGICRDCGSDCRCFDCAEMAQMIDELWVPIGGLGPCTCDFGLAVPGCQLHHEGPG